MEHFKLIRAGIDVAPYLAEIASVEGAWELNAGRKTKIKVQREADAIPIRGMQKSMAKGRAPRDVHETRFTNTSEQFPKIRELLTSIAAELDSELSRARVVKLPSGGKVYPHVDRGEYYRARDRYHLVFKTAPGNTLSCGDETLHMREGELWWFDNQQEHAAENASNEDRIHFIFDLKKRQKIAA